ENPRLEALVKELDENPKAIVWCMFRQDVERVMRRLRKEGFRPLDYYGKTKGRDRPKNLDTFMRDERYGPLVGQPGAGGRGLDISRAESIIHYSHTFNGIHRAQSEERGTKAGGH